MEKKVENLEAVKSRLETLLSKPQLFLSNYVSIGNELTNIAIMCTNQGKDEEALGYLHRLLELQNHKWPSSNHPDIAATLNNIGLIYYDQGRNNDALNYFTRALDIKQTQLHYDAVSVAATLNNIGLVYEDQGEHDKALEFFTKTLEIDQSKSRDHLNAHKIGETLYNIGIVYENKSELKKALDYYSRSLEAFKKSLKANHENIAAAIESISRVRKLSTLNETNKDFDVSNFKGLCFSSYSVFNLDNSIFSF